MDSMDFLESQARSLGETLTINVVPLPHNWVRLPQAYVNKVIDDKEELPAVLRLRRVSLFAEVSEDVLVAWNGLTTSQIGCIDLPRELADSLHLKQGESVSFSIARGLMEAAQVHVSVASQADWEVVEADAESLTRSILNEVKVVRVGDEIPVWIRGQSSVRVRIQSVAPRGEGLLRNGTVVSIEPPPQLRTAQGAAVQAPSPAGRGNADRESGVQHQRPTIKGPSRLRVQAWEVISEALMLRVPGQATCRSSCTTAAFVHPDLAADIALDRGAACSVCKDREDGIGSRPLLAVYSHPDVTPGHLCVARAVMQQLAFTENAQVWLSKASASQCPLARVSEVSISRMHPFALRAAAPAPEGSAAPAHGDDDDPVGDGGALATIGEARSAAAKGFKALLSVAAQQPDGGPLKAVMAAAEAADDADAAGVPQDAPEGLSAVASQPLRQLLRAWLQAQADYLSKVPGQNTPVSRLVLPRTTMLTLQAGDASAHDAYQVTWVTASTAYRLVAVSPSDGALGGITVALGGALEFPVSNPILCLRTWARDVFWSPPEHARPAKAALRGLMPRGQGWLDHELRYVLGIAMPYLSVRVQPFWKSATMPPPGGVLVAGGRGSGKTALLDRAAAFLAAHPATRCHVSRMSCRSMAGDKMKRIAKWLQSCFVTALTHAPAVVLLDDVDALVPTVPEHVPPQEQHMLEFANEFLASALDWLREQVTETGSQVLIIASCTDATRLPKLLRATGRLDHFIEVGTPSTAERAGMLEHMLRLRGMPYTRAGVDHAARRTEGFDSSDLAVLIERAALRARYGALARPGASGAPLAEEDWDESLKGLQPSAAWEAGTKDAMDDTVRGWVDVGGMAEARNALYESIELPLRFAKLVAKAPLRLRTGVLLYGPPGCGKTHIVRAAVAAAGVRFIGVKGPELLNKYIGASEEAVRSTFARAQAAAPCVLFFDEFDSIAPQRGSGSDSTGVTERMVNQLLTELDGVEKLTGVCVVAASNRPDLIDTALLRPGRLDRLIYCGFPNTDERRAILDALFSRVSTDGPIDSAMLAAGTAGFSGADLRAIVSEAQLGTVMAHLEKLTAAEAAGGVHNKHAEHMMPKVTPTDVQRAFDNARPSLSRKDRAGLDAKYRRFTASREGSAQPFSAATETSRRSAVERLDKMRVALA